MVKSMKFLQKIILTENLYRIYGAIVFISARQVIEHLSANIMCKSLVELYTLKHVFEQNITLVCTHFEAISCSSSLNHWNRIQNNGECNRIKYENAASAAEAAAESAKEAIAAAEAAAYLVDKERRTSGNRWNGATVNDVPSQIQADQFKVQKYATQRSSHDSTSHYTTNEPMNHVDMQKMYRRHSYNNPAQSDVKFDESDYDEEMEIEQPPNGINLPPNQPVGKIHRRHSYNVPSSHSDIKFDESDCDDDDGEMEYSSSKEPPRRPAPQMPGVHPKLPDYDTLAARFEALKYRKT